MLHARDDYNRIQDPAGKIPADEPVFLLRGQDPAAPAAVRAWVVANEAAGGDPTLSVRALGQALQMEQWQQDHAIKPADGSPARVGGASLPVPDPAPTLGRIVHYVTASDSSIAVAGVLHEAALIVHVAPTATSVTLRVFSPFAGTAERLVVGALHDPGMTAGTWHWPERS